MHIKRIILCSLLIIYFSFVFGCSYNNVGSQPLDVETIPQDIVDSSDSSQNSNSVDESMNDYFDRTINYSDYYYDDIEELLKIMSVAKFGTPSWLDSQDSARIRVLREINTLFEPVSTQLLFQPRRFRHCLWYNITHFHIDLLYGDGIPQHGGALIVWTGIKADSEKFHISRGSDSNTVYWSQHGYEFEADLPTHFTDEEIHVFCNVQPISSWEIEGNALSLTIQGMESVKIFCEDGKEIARRRSGSTIAFSNRIELEVLYKILDEGYDTVGYRWIADDTQPPLLNAIGEHSGDFMPQKHRFAMEPGEYTFHAEGVIGEPDLVVKHFEYGELISIVEFGELLAGQPVSGFTLTVTPDPSGWVFTSN